jgi:hypothetical protein
MMNANLDDTDVMTSDQRLRAIADVLAAGILRLHARAALSAIEDKHTGPEIRPESSPNGLEVPDETVLNVPRG